MFNLAGDQLLMDDLNTPLYTPGVMNQETVAIAEKSILNLMKSQLNLTEKHLRMQHAMYKKYCQSLNLNMRQKKKPKSEEKILYGKTKRREKLTYSQAVKLVQEEMKLEQRELDDLQKSLTQKSTNHTSRKSTNESSAASKSANEYSIKSAKSSSRKSANNSSRNSANNSTRKSANDSSRKSTNTDSSSIMIDMVVDKSVEEEIGVEEYDDDFDSESEIHTDI
eukprot:TRINITY_DN8659_c0_g1_i3.p1 TRINITY_DN8659_c0_g1~~TRINITY_DN8659_c0_g1_i3.p1  ORF type:complete len:223 (+),score=49.32 TRINITY_DN8659_c0_g1_i3:1-669(+)